MIKKIFTELITTLKSVDKKTSIIFLSIAFLQTVSWYFGSRTFFRKNLSSFFSNENISEVEFIYWFTSDFTLFFVIPLLIILLIFKEKPRDFGLSFGDKKIGFSISIIAIGIMLPILWIASSSSDFLIAYPHLISARNSWQIFFIYEIGMLAYLFAWEFIWRGFTLFGLYEKFGNAAIYIQMIPFVILHNGKPPLETFGAIAGGILLGFIALRTKSFLYCFFIHAGVMFSIDLFSVLRFNSRELGIGFEAVINILKYYW